MHCTLQLALVVQWLRVLEEHLRGKLARILQVVSDHGRFYLIHCSDAVCLLAVPVQLSEPGG
jgi:hypothetical protein